MSIVRTALTGGSDWGPRLRKARHVVEREGVLGLATRLLRWSLASYLDAGKLHFFSRDLRAPLPPELPLPEGVELRLARPDEMDELLRGGNPGHPRDLLHERFRCGDRCFVAVDERGGIAHCRWVTTRRAYVPELESEVVLGPGHAYMYDGFTRPDMRRRGIDGLIRCLIFRTLREAGALGVHSCVRGDNPGGLRAAGRWQLPAGHVWHLRLRRRATAFRLPVRMPASLQIVACPTAAAGTGARSWRRWFESWADKPLAHRSTGFGALPERYFVETADHIREALALSPEHDRVLDVGCDSAMLSRHLVPVCRRLVGVDFVHRLLADSTEARQTAGGRRMSVVNADGRRLPFADGAYTKVYCAGMIHTLATHAEGMEVIHELVRVCAPGGSVLLAAVPDRARRWWRYREAWRRGGARARARLVAALVAPAWVKRLARRWMPAPEEEGLVTLEYDLGAMRATLAASGLDCRVIEFPPTYWSRDFRLTRASLLIRLPARGSR